MALPTSRNTTYAPGSDIRSADLNALQDCIVGGKHGLISRPLGATSFLLTAGGAASLASDRWTFSGSAGLFCNLALPVGTTITEIIWRFDRGGGGTMTFKLIRRTLLDNVTAAVDVISRTDNTTTGWRSDSDLPAYMTQADESLWLNVTGSAATNVFGGAVLNLQRA